MGTGSLSVRPGGSAATTLLSPFGAIRWDGRMAVRSVSAACFCARSATIMLAWAELAARGFDFLGRLWTWPAPIFMAMTA